MEASVSETLLIELLTEELPPRLLSRMGEAFAAGIADALKVRQFAPADAAVQGFASPRRLAVSVAHVAPRQPDRTVERKGPAKAAGFAADGSPSPALAGFARSCGVAVEALQTGRDPKGNEIFIHRSTQKGQTLAEALPDILAEVLPRLPVAKVMRWGSGDAQFVRPVHGLVALHGAEVVPLSVMGLAAGNATRGHRFLSQGPVVIPHAERYAETLATEGCVLASFGERREHIRAALKEAAAGAQTLADDALLDEVTALVEWPAVYAGTFSEEFLSVPQECLILSMRQHQKYFPLGDAEGRLQPRFLLVSNIATSAPEAITQGNERVLRARLSDARFFFDQDRKTPLADRIHRLHDVVYHNKLGSVLDRVHRLRALSRHIATLLDADPDQADRAAFLMKGDLVSDMVGEFPELQGIMGRHYARHDGEPEAVAEAIEAHYHPRFAQDTLPQGPLGASVALADKLDTLVGIYGIGQVPTGDKDPFGLRRAALGVIRILMEQSLPLELPELLQKAVDGFAAGVLSPTTVDDLTGFIMDRLRGALRERGFTPEEIESVVSQTPARLDQVLPRLEAVRRFSQLPEADSLSAANKRIRNILKKSESAHGPAVQSEHLADAAEHALYQALLRIEPEVDDHLSRRNYQAALQSLATVRSEVDTFFDQVMVMAEDPVLRANRLALLWRMESLMNQVADISKLGG
jgi:glycyl-tRNA synthetase beta chain